MKYDKIVDCIENVYGYAVNHTYTREEADDLAQEILFTAVRQLPKLRDEGKFEPWLWAVAANVTKSFRRSKGRQRAMYSYDTLENVLYADEYFAGQEEIYDSLRAKIAMLSAIYREIIVLYYYDGLSTKTIASKLEIPEGTVRWRLTEARKKLKKEWVEMKETALRPVKMCLSIYGTGNYNGDTIPFPTVFINDALSQNILYYCYEQPNTIEELAKTCGVPAYYIEDRIENLLNREAVVEISKNKYQTNFIIWTDQYGIYCEKNAETVLMPILKALLNALKSIAKEAGKIPFYKADKCETDLFYLYGAMAFSYARQRYCKLPYPEIKEKYDGNKWCYLGDMETGKHHRLKLGIQLSANLGSRGNCSHTVYTGLNGIEFRPMMQTDAINVCEDILCNGRTEEIDSATDAIQAGYIRKKEDGGFFVTVPYFTKKQKTEFDAIADKYLAPLMPEYCKIVDNFIAGYKKLFPKHLQEDADRMCYDMFLGLYAKIVEYAQRVGEIGMPSQNCYCDVLMQFKES